jgi:hypothetical protein
MSTSKTIVKSAKRWFCDVDQKKARAQMRNKYGDRWHAELGFSNLTLLKQQELFTEACAGPNGGGDMHSPGRVTEKVRLGMCHAPDRVVEECKKKGKMIPVALQFEKWAAMCHCGASSSDQGPWCSDACGGCSLTADNDTQVCDFCNDANGELCGHHHRLSTLG